MSTTFFDKKKKAVQPGNIQSLGSRLVPWVEKYRPRNVKDISHQEDVVKTLLKSIETGNVPHLLFYGPPGTGKTTSALAFAHELYGPELLHERLLELNASDERGIKVVREKIKLFASTSVGRASYKGRPCPHFKLIILDEADSMTEDAQSALRRTMELYTRVTRFILICNYVSRIIEPIASRCAKFRFQPLAHLAISERLKYICEEEKIQYTNDSISTIIDVSQGDMRKAITLLQSSAQYNENKVESDVVRDVAGILPEITIQSFAHAMTSKRYCDLEKYCTDLVCEGYGLDTILHQIHEYIIEDESINDAQKSLLSIRFAQVDKALEEGSNEELQLRWILSHAQQIYSKVIPAVMQNA